MISILEGYLTGIAMIVFIGPVFFLLLTTSLGQGTKAGLAVALGIIVSDVVCALLCYFGLSQFLTAEANQFWIAIIGGVLLISMGLSYLMKKPKIENISLKSTSISAVFVKGFLVNFVNPFVFMVWIGIIEVGKSKTETELELLFYLVAVLLGIFTIDVSKVFLSKKIKAFIQPNLLLWVFRVSGCLMVVFGIRLFYLVW